MSKKKKNRTTHPTPDEVGTLSIHDPNFLEELDRRARGPWNYVTWEELEAEDKPRSGDQRGSD